MRHGGQAVLALNAVHDHQRLVPRAAARAVGDGTEIRLKLQQRRNGLLEQDPFAFFGFGREKFKGEDRALGLPRRRKDVSNEMHAPILNERVRDSTRHLCQAHDSEGCGETVEHMTRAKSGAQAPQPDASRLRMSSHRAKRLECGAFTAAFWTG